MCWCQPNIRRPTCHNCSGSAPGSPPKYQSKGWYGIDLDGTLVVHDDGWIDGIGAPIEPMCDRVRHWLGEGIEVRIMTARVNRRWANWAHHERAIRAFCYEQFGQYLEVTCEKDPDMIELWDDRAVRVVRNTGERCCETS